MKTIVKKKSTGKLFSYLTLARYSRSPNYGLLNCSSSAAESSAKRASYDSAPPYLLQPLHLATYLSSVIQPSSSTSRNFLFGAYRNGFSGVCFGVLRYRKELKPRLSTNSSEHVDSNRGRPPGRFQLGMFATSKSLPMFLSSAWESRFRRGMPGMSGSEGFGSGRRGTG